jgi:hypothetical protein
MIIPMFQSYAALASGAAVPFYTVIQANGGVQNNTTVAKLTVASSLTAGNLLVVSCHRQAALGTTTLFQVSDISVEGTATVGAFTMDVNYVTISTSDVVAIFSASITGGGTVTTKIAGSAGNYYTQSAYELNLNTGSMSLDPGKTSFARANSATPDSGNITSVSSGIFIGCFGGDDSVLTSTTIDPAWTLVYKQEDGANEPVGAHGYRVWNFGSTTDSISFTVSNSANWICIAAEYK